ncbi:DNA topoisomerase IV subunit B [Spirochaeta lutea]|uniref:DNA topoisomerase (ATP-hydrolyzing) n=1 Tax=Spirochaeta lutea TaxID=1480694 RepID=A0A098QTK9_9SPIO|nr:DNA topoisomerase IV subunit B [Spirochaeta lutea]KGE70733.1 DNA topoisomerase IV subunit B [Spirochaeta lutea]
MATSKTVYDESKIKTLSSLEHIRLRSGMYIGRLGDGTNPDDGIYILLKEVIDNSIDEFIMGHGNKIKISLEDKRIRVRDYGRGIPLGKLVECVSIINTGAKYNTEVFQFSVGLNGVGTKAVNALSCFFRVVAFREGRYAEAVFAKGVLQSEKKGKAPKEADGTYVEFEPDPEIFGDYTYNREFIEERLWNYAYLNTGLTLYLGKEAFKSENGLRDLLDGEVGEDGLYETVHHKDQRLEFAFTHTAGNYGENYWSFVNGQYTSDGGTHLSAFREGILKGINEFYKKNFTGQDVREGIAGAVSVKLENPIFESQTKNKLGNTEVRSWIVAETRQAVDDFLHKNTTASKKLLDKIVQNEKLRKELAVVKKEAKEAAKKIALKIPNLRDCKFHFGDKKGSDESTIFITEGQSASGSMVSSRDVYTQAVFSLRGKPQNMFGRKRAEIYKNEELYNMMMALGIENDIEGLRYNRIVIATDADHDGFHIRNLMLTFFLSYFEELVVQGHVYLLETPLFRVRNKKETRYCYNPKERDQAIGELTSPEVTRFKGLGEISPKEFGQFIGPDIRLIKVDIKSLKAIHETLEFFMGKNTPTRRSFIMENLI